MISPSNLDAKLTIRRILDLNYQKGLETFAFYELRYDLEKSLDWPEEPKQKRIKKLLYISAAYPRVFSADIGEVRDKDFEVNAIIDAESSTVSSNR